MSRRWFLCRNPACGAVLGRLTAADGLVLQATVHHLHAFFDTGRVEIACPVCGTTRTFRGVSVKTTPARD